MYILWRIFGFPRRPKIDDVFSTSVKNKKNTFKVMMAIFGLRETGPFLSKDI